MIRDDDPPVSAMAHIRTDPSEEADIISLSTIKKKEKRKKKTHGYVRVIHICIRK